MLALLNNRTRWGKWKHPWDVLWSHTFHQHNASNIQIPRKTREEKNINFGMTTSHSCWVGSVAESHTSRSLWHHPCHVFTNTNLGRPYTSFFILFYFYYILFYILFSWFCYFSVKVKESVSPSRDTKVFFTYRRYYSAFHTFFFRMERREYRQGK